MVIVSADAPLSQIEPPGTPARLRFGEGGRHRRSRLGAQALVDISEKASLPRRSSCARGRDPAALAMSALGSAAEGHDVFIRGRLSTRSLRGPHKKSLIRPLALADWQGTGDAGSDYSSESGGTVAKPCCGFR